MESELSTRQTPASSRKTGPEPSGGWRDCKFNSRLIVLATSLVTLFIAFLLLVVPVASPKLVNPWPVSQLQCTVFVNRTVVTESGQQYIVGQEVVATTDPGLKSLRDRFRAIIAIGFCTLVCGLLGIASALSPNLQNDRVKCRLVLFISFTLPTCVAGIFIALYCFGFRMQANYIARMYFDCLRPYLPKQTTRPDLLDLDSELLIAGWLAILACASGLVSAYWGGNMLGWRAISRQTVIACNSFSSACGGGLMVAGFIGMSSSSEAGALAAGNFIVVAFGVVVVGLSALGLMAAKKESLAFCNIYTRVGGLFTAVCLAVSILFFLYPEAMDMFLLSHWSTISKSIGGMSHADYQKLLSEKSSFVGIITTLLCTVLVLNIFAAFTYANELKKAGGGGMRQLQEVEFVDVFERRKQREQAFRARMQEEGAASSTRAAKEAEPHSKRPARSSSQSSASSAASSVSPAKKSFLPAKKTPAGRGLRGGLRV